MPTHTFKVVGPQTLERGPYDDMADTLSIARGAAALVITPPYRAGPGLSAAVLGKRSPVGVTIEEVGSGGESTTYRVSSDLEDAFARSDEYHMIGARLVALANNPALLVKMEEERPFQRRNVGFVPGDTSHHMGR